MLFLWIASISNVFLASISWCLSLSISFLQLSRFFWYCSWVWVKVRRYYFLSSAPFLTLYSNISILSSNSDVSLTFSFSAYSLKLSNSFLCFETVSFKVSIYFCRDFFVFLSCWISTANSLTVTLILWISSLYFLSLSSAWTTAEYCWLRLSFSC